MDETWQLGIPNVTPENLSAGSGRNPFRNVITSAPPILQSQTNENVVSPRHLLKVGITQLLKPFVISSDKEFM